MLRSHAFLVALPLVIQTPAPLPPVQETPAASTPELCEIMDAIDALATPLVDDGITVGMVIGIVRGDELCVRGYGEVALGSGVLPDAQTIYEIGSISKVFTGLLLADAVTREVVALDDPVQGFYEDVFELTPFEDQPIELWHLSTHTSGLSRMPSNFRPEDPDDPYADYTHELMYAYLSKAKLRRAPGTKYAYSNLGAALLGNLIAREQELDYESLLRTRIADPLGLKHTSIALTPWMQEHLAPGYDVDQTPKANWSLPTFAGAGGIRSNVHDMLRFASAALHPEGGPLAEAFPLSMEIRHREPQGATVALGWHAASQEATRLHNGQTGGYHSFLALWPEGDAAVVVLANTTSSLVDLCADSALLLMMGHEPHALEYPKAIDLDRDAAAELVGRYKLGIFASLTVTLEDTGLFAQVTAQPAVRIYPSAPDKFFYRAIEAEITFERDEAGAITGLSLLQNGAVTKGKRVE